MDGQKPEPELPRKRRSARVTAGLVEVFTPYIVRNGQVIYPKRAKVFHFWVKN